jgi:hypothetical protein
MHAILDQALALWGGFLSKKIEIPADIDTVQDHLCEGVRDYIHALYKDSAEKRGYVKYWMTHAFDAFSRPGMSMDTDMLSWALLCDGTIIQPRPNLFEPVDRKFSFNLVVEDQDGMDG